MLLQEKERELGLDGGLQQGSAFAGLGVGVGLVQATSRLARNGRRVVYCLLDLGDGLAEKKARSAQGLISCPTIAEKGEGLVVNGLTEGRGDG